MLTFTTSNHWHTFHHHHHYHHVVLSAQISLTLSCHPSLSSIASRRFSMLHPVSVHVCRSKLVFLPLLVHVRGSQEVVTNELVPTSPAVSCVSGSFNLDSFRDGLYVAVQSLLCGVLPPGVVQYCSQHSCVVAVKLFLHMFS